MISPVLPHKEHSFKGTGTGNCNLLKVVRLDRSWFGESLVAIHNLDNCPFIFYLSEKFLATERQKLFFICPKLLKIGVFKSFARYG
jgi:hypothetical protein